MKELNKEYIKGKKKIDHPLLMHSHTHSAGYYSESCSGCLAEGLFKEIKKNDTPRFF